MDDTTQQENAFKKVNQHEKEMTEIIKKALAHIELRNVSVDIRKAHQSSSIMTVFKVQFINKPHFLKPHL